MDYTTPAQKRALKLLKEENEDSSRVVDLTVEYQAEAAYDEAVTELNEILDREYVDSEASDEEIEDDSEEDCEHECEDDDCEHEENEDDIAEASEEAYERFCFYCEEAGYDARYEFEEFLSIFSLPVSEEEESLVEYWDSLF